MSSEEACSKENEEPSGISVDAYYAGVRALGIRAIKPISAKHSIGTTRDGSPAHVPRPECLSPAERQAALELLKRLWADD